MEKEISLGKLVKNIFNPKVFVSMEMVSFVSLEQNQYCG